MNLIYYATPFPHVVMREFYSPDEYEAVWAELVSLKDKSAGAETTGTATKDGVNLKRNTGVFLGQLYQEEYLSSPIIRANRKLFSVSVMQQLCGFDFVFQYLPATTFDETLVQFYQNGDYYKTHKDTAVFSATVVLYRPPRRYAGGVLRFTHFNYLVELEDNDCVLFPSFVPHEVTELRSSTTDPLNNRISITTFMNIV